MSTTSLNDIKGYLVSKIELYNAVDILKGQIDRESQTYFCINLFLQEISQ